jgi:mutator protein MutT
MKRVDAAIAIVTRGSHVLICQRKPDDTFGGLWEFPGGKQEDGETLEQCLARELREELNIAARPTVRLPPVEHDYPHVQIRLHPFICTHVSGEPELIECQQAKWIDPAALRDYEFPPANGPLIDRVVKHLTATTEVTAGDGTPRPEG